MTHGATPSANARQRAVRAPLLPILGLACLPLVLAGCGSGSAGGGGSPAAPASAASSPLVTAPAPPVVTSSPAPPETAATSHRCHTAEVAIQFLPGQGATGQSVRSVALRNTAGDTCTVRGYVGLQPLDGGGHPLPGMVQRGGGMLGTPAPTTVSLPPMAVAYFELEYSGLQSGPSPCPTSARVEVTPPDETRYLLVDAQLTPCAGGRLTITALHSGPPRA